MNKQGELLQRGKRRSPGGRLLSMCIALCMVLTLLPVSPMAEEAHTTIGTSGEIIGFAPLAETEKSVTTGTAIQDLELPETLTATVRTAVIAGEEPVQDSGSPDEDTAADDLVVAVTGSAVKAAESEWEETVTNVPVIWTSQPEYDMDTEGVYVFAPVIEGYTVSAELPVITVTVGQLAVAARGSQAVPTAVFAAENVSIGDMQITVANATTIQNQFNAKGSNIASVTSNNGRITIKLLQDITGRIEIHASGNYIFDADGHTFSGGSQNEAIGMGWNKNVTLELVGNGTYNSGVNNTLVVNNNTLIIKSAVVYGKLKNGGTLKFALEDGSSYFTVKNDSNDLFDEKNTMTKTQSSDITGTGTGLVVSQYTTDYYIGLDIAGTYAFSAAAVGYGEQEEKTVTITNIGRQDISSLLIELSGSNFSISPTSIANIATGNTATFAVKPNSGLSVGTHLDTITVSNEFVSQSFNVIFTVNAAPDAPTNLSVTPGNGQLILTWTAPASDSPITGYEVSTDDGASWESTGSTSTNYIVTGLTNGTSYTVKVRAVNAIGDGAESAGITAIPVAPTYTISGVIKDSDTNSGIAATLQLQEYNTDNNVGDAVTANPDGTYTILNVPAGDFWIEISATGYDSQHTTLIRISTGNVTGENYTLTKTVAFIAVADIAMTNAASVQVNADLALAGTVSPATATNQTITWSVEDANGTGATIIDGSTFRATSTGTATVKATVTNGLTVSSDYTKIFDITVTAAPVVTHTITATAGRGGSISPSGSVSVDNGGSQIFDITPNSNYSIADVMVDGVSQGRIARYTFSNVTVNHSISATFSYNGGRSGRGGSSSDNSSPVIVTPPTPDKPNSPTQGEIKVPGKVDIAGHWAKEDIEFVVSRGLFSGTSATTFSPNIAMTRGMFVTALGRLANADMSSYKESSYTDVKSDAYYMGYIEWASKNSIVNGTGNGKFAPDQSITREQMVVIMQNYGKVIGFTLPKIHEKNTFADSAKISAYAKDAVKQMQMAGVISGKNGNLFDPQGTATRAEVSVVLRRFVEL